MDTRINPYEDYEVSRGDAHILRNAGGFITDDVRRGILLSQQATQTKTIHIYHHTDCAAISAEIPGQDLAQLVQESVKNLVYRTNLKPGTLAIGSIHDIDTGLMREICSIITG